jgi:hypothetical protein
MWNSPIESAWLPRSVCARIAKGAQMKKLTIEMPDDLARDLEGVAAAQRKTVQQLALERLSSFISDLNAGSPEAVLRVVYEPPHLSAADVAELDAAISAGRMAVRVADLFSIDSTT